MGRFLRNAINAFTDDPRTYRNHLEFVTAGTHSFTVPEGVSRIRAIVVGGGGGGAASRANSHAGNGGVGYVAIEW